MMAVGFAAAGLAGVLDDWANSAELNSRINPKIEHMKTRNIFRISAPEK